MRIRTLWWVVLSAISLGLAGVVGLLLGGWLGDRLRGTAVALYFFARYVLGASFGSAIIGMVSDHFANQAMLEAGATGMAVQFRAAGLRSSMYTIPALMVLCSLSLLGAARTVAADMRRMQQLRD